MVEEIRTRTLEELISLHGKFYEIDGESWCDTRLSSWKFNQETGLYELMD